VCDYGDSDIEPRQVPSHFKKVRKVHLEGRDFRIVFCKLYCLCMCHWVYWRGENSRCKVRDRAPR
jgi:hypothetical protein